MDWEFSPMLSAMLPSSDWFLSCRLQPISSLEEDRGEKTAVRHQDGFIISTARRSMECGSAVGPAEVLNHLAAHTHTHTGL